MATKAKKKVEEVEDQAEQNDELEVIELEANLDDYPEPELLPPGFYKAEIQDVQVRNNQAGTGRYYAVKFVIPTSSFPSDYDEENWPDGMPVYYNLLRVPRAGDRRAVANIRRFMERIGVATDSNRIDPSEWIGKEAKLKVEHNTYEGVKREQIARNGIEAAD